MVSLGMPLSRLLASLALAVPATVALAAPTAPVPAGPAAAASVAPVPAEPAAAASTAPALAVLAAPAPAETGRGRCCGTCPGGNRRSRSRGQTAARIEEIVVTGTIGERLGTAGSASRIDGDALGEIRHTHIHEALSRLPGVWVPGAPARSTSPPSAPRC